MFLSTKEIGDTVKKNQNKLILLREAVLKACLIRLLTAAYIVRKLYLKKKHKQKDPKQDPSDFLGFLRFDLRSSFCVHLLLLLQLEMKMFFLRLPSPVCKIQIA